MNADLAERLGVEAPIAHSPLYALPTARETPRDSRSPSSWIRGIPWRAQSWAGRHHRFTGTVALFLAGCAFTIGTIGEILGLGDSILLCALAISVLLLLEGVVYAFPKSKPGVLP